MLLTSPKYLFSGKRSNDRLSLRHRHPVRFGVLGLHPVDAAAVAGLTVACKEKKHTFTAAKASSENEGFYKNKSTSGKLIKTVDQFKVVDWY